MGGFVESLVIQGVHNRFHSSSRVTQSSSSTLKGKPISSSSLIDLTEGVEDAKDSAKSKILD